MVLPQNNFSKTNTKRKQKPGGGMQQDWQNVTVEGGRWVNSSQSTQYLCMFHIFHNKKLLFKGVS
jgi:hypothetical protein